MGIGWFYFRVTEIMSIFYFIYNLVTSIMFIYACRLYLYEPDLDKNIIKVELYSHLFIIWIVFWMLRLAFWRDFEAFYVPESQVAPAI